MWILWIHDPLLDQKRKIRFWIRKSGFGFSHKKAPYANIFYYIDLATAKIEAPIDKFVT